MSLIFCLSLDTWSHIMLTHISPRSIEPQSCFYLSYCLSERMFSVVLYCWQTTLICLLILYAFLDANNDANVPSVLWRCWLGGRKGIRPVKNFKWWGAGVVVCLQQDADLHMAQLMPLPLTVSCFSTIQIGFTFLVSAHPGIVPEKGPLNGCVCVCSWCE